MSGEEDPVRGHLPLPALQDEVLLDPVPVRRDVTELLLIVDSLPHRQSRCVRDTGSLEGFQDSGSCPTTFIVDQFEVV